MPWLRAGAGVRVRYGAWCGVHTNVAGWLVNGGWRRDKREIKAGNKWASDGTGRAGRRVCAPLGAAAVLQSTNLSLPLPLPLPHRKTHNGFHDHTQHPPRTPRPHRPPLHRRAARRPECPPHHRSAHRPQEPCQVLARRGPEEGRQLRRRRHDDGACRLGSR